jgi:hypothetical protein
MDGDDEWTILREGRGTEEDEEDGGGTMITGEDVTVDDDDGLMVSSRRLCCFILTGVWYSPSHETQNGSRQSLHSIVALDASHTEQSTGRGRGRGGGGGGGGEGVTLVDWLLSGRVVRVC